MLVGKGPDTANLQWLKEAHYPHEWTGNDEGTLKVELAATGLGDDMNEYSVVELLSMLLAKQREDAEALAEEPIKDVVITVPPFWAQDERQALLDAAELAKMNVLGLMNENSAVAMKYAIDKKYDATKEHNVVFYDMGSTSVKTSLVSFYTDTSGKKEKDAFKVLAVAWDEGCGGHVIDSRLAVRFGKEFDEKHMAANNGESVLEAPRAMARLRIAGKKTKETLSANQETPVNVEALSNDIDFRSKITREEFNEMNQDIWERALAPVQKLLDDTGMSTSDIHAAVIVGGSSLIPQVQEQLKAKLGLDELTRNLDAFESAALGAGFYAAGLSPSFRVREVGVTDLYPFGVSATVSKSLARAEGDEVESEESVSEVVFEPKEPVPNRKYLVFSRSSNFTVSLKYTNPEVMSADTETDIGFYNMTGVNKCEKFNTTDKPKITLKLEIDRNGMATVTEAVAGVTEWTEKSVKIPRKKKKTEDEKTPKKKSKKSKDSGEDESADGKEPEPEKDSAESDPEDTNNEDTKEPEAVEEPEVIEEHKCEWNATLNVTLGEGEEAKEKEVQPYIGLDSGANKTMTGECANVNPEYEGDIVLMCFEAALTADTSDCTVVKYEIRSEKVARKVDLKKKYREKGISKMTKSKKEDANGRLAKIQKVMDEIHRLAKAKNDVEAHIFETRDMLEYNEELKAVLSDNQADEVRSGLSAAEEWMWEDYTYSEYVDKLYELRDAIKPALIRKDEAVSRPQVLARAHEAITKTQETLANESYMELMPANETEKMVEKTASFELYVKDQEEAQAALSLTDEPAFMSAEMESKLSKYEKAMAAAMAKKPKPKKPKSKKAKKAKKSAMELVSYETNAEQFDILSEFYTELQEDKSDDDIQAILDKRKDEGSDALTMPQFEELCAKLKVKKYINPIELWAEKHPPPEEEGDAESGDESEGEGDGEGGGWFSGWGSGDAADDDAEGEGDEGAEDTESNDAETEDTPAGDENEEGDADSTGKDDL